MTAIGFRVGVFDGGDGVLDVLPEVSAGENVLMFHRLEQGFDGAVSEADAEESRDLIGFEIEQIGGVLRRA